MNNGDTGFVDEGVGEAALVLRDRIAPVRPPVD